MRTVIFVVLSARLWLAYLWNAHWFPIPLTNCSFLVERLLILKEEYFAGKNARQLLLSQQCLALESRWSHPFDEILFRKLQGERYVNTYDARLRRAISRRESYNQSGFVSSARWWERLMFDVGALVDSFG